MRWQFWRREPKVYVLPETETSMAALKAKTMFRRLADPAPADETAMVAVPRLTLRYLYALALLFPHTNTDTATHTKVGLPDAEDVWCLGCSVCTTLGWHIDEIITDNETETQAICESIVREYESSLADPAPADDDHSRGFDDDDTAYGRRPADWDPAPADGPLALWLPRQDVEWIAARCLPVTETDERLIAEAQRVLALADPAPADEGGAS